MSLRQSFLFCVSLFITYLHVKLVSPANRCISEYVTRSCCSLMYISKSRDPSTEPWGTPIIMGRVSDISLLIAVYWILSVRYVFNNFKLTPLIPYCSNLARRMSWSTKSNVFWKSGRTPQNIFPSSIAFWTFAVMLDWKVSYYCLKTWRAVYVWVFQLFYLYLTEKRLACNYYSLVLLVSFFADRNHFCSF